MELTFEKWEDGRWFVVLPEYDGDQDDLEMVDGADSFLDYLTEDGLYVTVDVSLEDPGDDSIVLKLVVHDEIGGTYQVENLSEFKHDVWLTNTTLQGGKNRKLRVSERHKNLFLDVRAQAGYSIKRVLGQGGFGN